LNYFSKGPQFRCKELNYYYFNTLADDGICVNLNFFGEKHGKNGRDQHFSIISYYLKRAALKELISNTTDIVNIINSSQLKSNIYRRFEEKDEIEVNAYLLNPTNNQKFINKTREINNLKNFYNLQNVKINNNFYLNSTVYSDNTEFVDPIFLDSVIDKTVDTIKLNSKESDFSEKLNIEGNLKQKRERIEIMLRTTSKSPSPTKVTINTKKIANVSSFASKIASISNSGPLTSRQAAENEKPNYCNFICQNCTIKTLYTVNEINTINHNKRLVGQKKLIAELANHGHPSSRKIKDEFRNTEQSKSELLDHYRYAHNLY
jgi:hypothetical protein